MSAYSMRKVIAGMIPGRLVRLFASRYVGGDSLDKAIRTADELFEKHGLESTIDLLGEEEKTRERVEWAVAQYYKMLEAISERPYCTLSVKPGQTGFYVDPDLCMRKLDELAAACQQAGRRLTIDMEDTDLTDFTLSAYRELKPRYSILGTVLQARLFRTPKDVESLKGLQANIRACIGIYNVSPDKAYQKKRDMKEALMKMIGWLFDDGHYVCVATHDLEYLKRARAILAEKKIPKERYEFQMLMGVPRDEIQNELVKAGERVRLYVPYALNWDDAIAYLRRRMAASPSISALVLKNLVKKN